jgi:hypothetical protein
MPQAKRNLTSALSRTLRLFIEFPCQECISKPSEVEDGQNYGRLNYAVIWF